MSFIGKEFDSDLSFLYSSAKKCKNNPVGRDNIWQASPIQGIIPYKKNTIENLKNFEDDIAESIPRLGKYGRRRANKAYVRYSDTITKPSYINRLKGEVSGYEYSQFDQVERQFVSQPYSGSLVFSIFKPNDLFERRRPGYVPCLVSGSFVFDGDELHLNAFFRSMSIIEFGVYDMIFLRKTQMEVIENISCYNEEDFPKRHKLGDVKPGPINIQMGRCIIQKRIARNTNGHIPRNEAYEIWSSLALSRIDDLYT